MRIFATTVVLLLLCIAVPNTAQSQTITDGAVAYYPLDGHAFDASGNDLNGLIRGPVAGIDRFGKENGAMVFDGINDHLMMPGLDLRYSDQFSVYAWIQSTNIQSETYKVFVRQDPFNHGAPDFALDFKGSGRNLVFALNTDRAYVELSHAINPTDVADGEWHFVAGTYDGAIMRLYLDGVEVAARGQSGKLSYQGGENRIGCMRGKHFFRGSIDDVCFYNRPLSAEEIQSLYTNKDLTGENSTLVQGNVYNDANANCSREPGESGFQNRLVKASPGPVYGWTDENGNYEMRLPNGEYTLSLMPRAYWRQTCPQSGQGYDISIKKAGETIRGLDFGTVAEREVRGLSLFLSGGRARPGFEATYTILYRNIGSVPYTGRVYLDLDSHLEFIASTPANSAYNPPVVEWQLNNIPIDGSGIITVSVRLKPETPLGIHICSYVTADAQDPDIELLNAGGDSFCHEVRGSYDPNDISVSPEGAVYDREETLVYTIRFQNTGTAPASRVVVLDTLPAGLDLESLRLGAVSHPYEFSLSGANVASWTFEGIELPDSHANEAASHGHIQYAVRMKQDAEIGTRIQNRAAIYFDFNEPIITNTVETVLVSHPTSVNTGSEHVRLEAFPNPADDVLQIRSTSEMEGELVLSNLLGQRVLTQPVNSSKRITLDVSAITSGRYFLRIPTANGVQLKAVDIKR